MKKVIVLPCSGIGKPAGEIGRQAAYTLADQLRPEQCVRICLARLMIDEPDSVSLVRDNLVITLDGCPEDCARKNVERIKNKVNHAFHVTDFMNQFPELKPEGILNLGEDGSHLATRLAEHLAAEVDRLTGEGA
ncbi:MAG: hypothetical protein GYA42_07985 [Syntrophomonadaceae bacterium]|nr:hypothetical protein [Syntrophomonadaceae bacterium]